MGLIDGVLGAVGGVVGGSLNTVGGLLGSRSGAGAPSPRPASPAKTDPDSFEPPRAAPLAGKGGGGGKIGVAGGDE